MLHLLLWHMLELNKSHVLGSICQCLCLFKTCICNAAVYCLIGIVELEAKQLECSEDNYCYQYKYQSVFNEPLPPVIR